MFSVMVSAVTSVIVFFTAFTFSSPFVFDSILNSAQSPTRASLNGFSRGVSVDSLPQPAPNSSSVNARL